MRSDFRTRHYDCQSCDVPHVWGGGDKVSEAPADAYRLPRQWEGLVRYTTKWKTRKPTNML